MGVIYLFTIIIGFCFKLRFAYIDDNSDIFVVKKVGTTFAPKMIAIKTRNELKHLFMGNQKRFSGVVWTKRLKEKDQNKSNVIERSFSTTSYSNHPQNDVVSSSSLCLSPRFWGTSSPSIHSPDILFILSPSYDNASYVLFYFYFISLCLPSHIKQ